MQKVFKKSISWLLICSMILMVNGCSKKEQPENDTDSNIEETQNENKEQKQEEEQSEKKEIDVEGQAIYDSLFNLENDVRVSIDIEEEELQKIQDDYDYYKSFHSKSPIYRMCDLTIEINGEKHVIEEVGIRMKGNTSRRSFYDSATGVYNLIHFKFSFDETFDDEKYYGEDAKVWESEEAKQERKDRKFATLNGLEMKWNRTTDATYTRETYAFRMYRDFGVLAPMNTMGQCKVNDTNWGIYKIYEPVDKVFLERNLPEEELGGDLYKCTWGGGEPACYVFGSYGVDDADSGYFNTYDLKTNKKDSNHEQLENFMSTISGNMTLDELDKVVDTDKWVKFSAVSYMLGMPDDLRNNYNNHYVYFKGNTNQAVFIAYDCDIAMGTDNWNPTGNFMVTTDPYSDMAYGANSMCYNPLVTSTLVKGGLLESEYTAALKEVVNSKWWDYSTFEAMYNEGFEKYGDISIPDFEIRKGSTKELEMNIEDKYNSGTKSNGNMTVKEYMEKMVANCKSYLE